MFCAEFASPSVDEVNLRLCSKDTVVSKEPDIIGFKDKTNDISKRIFTVNDNKTQQPKN